MEPELGRATAEDRVALREALEDKVALEDRVVLEDKEAMEDKEVTVDKDKDLVAKEGDSASREEHHTELALLRTGDRSRKTSGIIGTDILCYNTYFKFVHN
ncbi:hypothetical protein J6590_006006 [Homalodisca vitripennis]|nr:hypothetical protein J6590_006006 [Homalodisca vitripennis]